ncbi:MAG: 2-amino-4-hydroxy-6-hydroxymethyldihydropteridine diphosphokinase [Oscillatoriales cyanobacterium RM1_1_9]|nr:2-amino-4-hydroxy-6-hydroxymethyldihydropteridine diphosphokinase [Oscillatoriales cyanobacterium RM2_1_1]NJO70986.1 2-amino-4-hydroxy-6-hydroxymethyldihydropteridine diphosphokinase [Oscillatoriales cyanobacterium RM1_1_9]
MTASKPVAKPGSKLAAIALGSNLGDSLTIIQSALDLLNYTPNVTVQSHSHWYQTIPIGPPQPDYINGCAILDVQTDAVSLLEILLGIEQQFGRIRQARWGPRTLDLDLLLLEDLRLTTPFLEIPHPRMRDRAFVLIPLAEIAPHWIDPVTGKTIAQLAQW